MYCSCCWCSNLDALGTSNLISLSLILLLDDDTDLLLCCPLEAHTIEILDKIVRLELLELGPCVAGADGKDSGARIQTGLDAGRGILNNQTLLRVLVQHCCTLNVRLGVGLPESAVLCCEEV